VAPAARCRVCSTAANGSRSCRRCGSTTVDATASVNATLQAAGLAPASPDRPPGSRQSVSGGRDQGPVPPGDLEGTRASPRPGLSRPGMGTSGPLSPGTDPLGFAAALRSLDRCPGCGEPGTHGHVCEGCTCLG
jgi:hypothetical protein